MYRNQSSRIWKTEERSLSMVLCTLHNWISIFYFKQQRFQRFSLSNNHSTTFASLTKVQQKNKKMSRFKQVNQLFDQSENFISCDYYDADDLNKIVINQSDLTVIYLNISSLALHINKLKLFLSLIKNKFDIICISESRITKNNSLTTILTSMVIILSMPQQNLKQVAR